jgi:hypothetical protein
LKTFVHIIALTSCMGAAGFASDDGLTFFEKNVRSILIERCYSCHSEESGKRKGNLLLDRRSGWETGGDTGPAILPGKPESSHVIQAIRYTDEDLQMPPKSRIPQAELDVLEKWVAMGAPDPRDEALAGAVRSGTIDYAAARRGWAFRPVVAQQKTIDAHVDTSLTEANIVAAPLASPRERLRRIAYDLTGLPPSPEELAAFEKDAGPEAWSRIIDELLTRPGFGEKWGRHWLDVARYADSNGGDRNFTFHQAWRYRNYVINAFNQDKSYYTFVREQVAGDLLPWSDPAERREQLIGSTFLALGPKMLTERDKEKLRMDVADEQIDTLGRAFLGLTVGCARCHDHKFDPISQKDYYAFAGLMRSTQVVMGTRNGCVNVASWVEQALPGDDGMDPELTRDLERLELAMRLTVEKSYRKKSGDRKVSMDLPFAGVIIDDEDAELIGTWKTSSLFPKRVGKQYVHDDKKNKGEKKAIFRASLPENGEYEVRISYNASPERERKVPVTIEAEGGLHHAHLNQTVLPEIAELFQPVGRYHFEKGAAANVTISTEGTTGFVIVDAVQFVPVADLEREAEALADAASDMTDTNTLFAMSEDQLKKEIERVIKDLATAEVAMAPRDAPDAGDVHLRVRGVVSQHGPLIPRGFLTVLDPDGPPRIPEGTSGRLPMADWLNDTPLLDRVIVNRIWYHLMGQGIVRTVDNFGKLGDTPSHPELLDDLAARFRASGGSIKSLVRDIVSSQVYQRSSDRTESLTMADPENRLLAHQNRRRLSAEELRDSMLLLSDRLDRNPATASAGKGTDLDKPMDWSKKTFRAVYLPVARNNSANELSVFDMANPDLVSGDRPGTTVPTQALYLLNASFVSEQAKALAKRIRTQHEIPEEQVHALYQRVLLRTANQSETLRATRFITDLANDTGSAEEALGHFTQILFASTEFQFID